MTRPAKLPLYGKVKFRRARKERLLALWQAVVKKTAIEIHQGVRVESIRTAAQGFEIATTSGAGTRQYGVAGDRASWLAAAPRRSRRRSAQSRHTASLMRRNTAGSTCSSSAAATARSKPRSSLSRHPVASVTLAYRGPALDRAKPANLKRLEAVARAGKVFIMLDAHVRAIEPGRVIIDQPDRRLVPVNDAVIICAGGTLPTALLADIGVEVERKFGTA